MVGCGCGVVVWWCGWEMEMGMTAKSYMVRKLRGIIELDGDVDSDQSLSLDGLRCFQVNWSLCLPPKSHMLLTR